MEKLRTFDFNAGSEAFGGTVGSSRTRTRTRARQQQTSTPSISRDAWWTYWHHRWGSSTATSSRTPETAVPFGAGVSDSSPITSPTQDGPSNTLMTRPTEGAVLGNGNADSAAAKQTVPASSSSSSSDGGVSGGVIAAAVVVPILVLAALGALIFFLLRRRRRQREADGVPRSPGGPQMEQHQVYNEAPRLPPLGISRKPVPSNQDFGPSFGVPIGQANGDSFRSSQPELHMGDGTYLVKAGQATVVNGRYLGPYGSDRDPFDDPETPASRLTEPFVNGSQVGHATPTQQPAPIPFSPLDNDRTAKDDDAVSEVSDVSYQEDVPEETAVVQTAQRASVIKLHATPQHSPRGSNASNEASPTDKQSPTSYT